MFSRAERVQLALQAIASSLSDNHKLPLLEIILQAERVRAGTESEKKVTRKPCVALLEKYMEKIVSLEASNLPQAEYDRLADYIKTALDKRQFLLLSGTQNKWAIHLCYTRIYRSEWR